MTEIEKMYENAGVEHGSCKNYKRLECNSSFCDSGMCPYGIGGEKNPFTAEKQLELIKWLLKKKIDLTMNFAFMGNEFYISTDRFTCSFAKTFELALARLINNLWQSLTDQEKEEIRGILNENS